MPSMGLLGAIGGAAEGLGKYLNDELALERQKALNEQTSELRREDNRVDAEMRDKMARERLGIANEQALSLEEVQQTNRVELIDKEMERAGMFEPVEGRPGTWFNSQTGKVVQLNDKDRYIKIAGETNEFGVQGREQLFDTVTQSMVSMDAAQQEGGGVADPEESEGPSMFQSEDAAIRAFMEMGAGSERAAEKAMRRAMEAGDLIIEAPQAAASDDADADFTLSDMAEDANSPGTESSAVSDSEESSGKKHQLGVDEIIGKPAREIADFAGDVASGAVDMVADAGATVKEFNTKANFKIWLDDMTRVKKVPIAQLPPEKLKEGLALFEKGEPMYQRVAEALKKQQEKQVASR